jgi:hypothetical protein
MPRAPHVAPVLGPQRENFGAPEQLTGKQQNPKGDKTGPRSGSEAHGGRMSGRLGSREGRYSSERVGCDRIQKKVDEIAGANPIGDRGRGGGTTPRTGEASQTALEYRPRKATWGRRWAKAQDRHEVEAYN